MVHCKAVAWGGRQGPIAELPPQVKEKLPPHTTLGINHVGQGGKRGCCMGQAPHGALQHGAGMVAGQPLTTEQPHQPQQGSAPHGASQAPKPRSLGQVGASMGGWASCRGAAQSTSHPHCNLLARPKHQNCALCVGDLAGCAAILVQIRCCVPVPAASAVCVVRPSHVM